jgi:uncharacterized protein YjbJ (UPF0337 family)
VNEDANSERTAGGLVGRVVGKAKEALGGAIENEDLAREGRLQQAQSEAELEARREAEKAEKARAHEEQAITRERQTEIAGQRDQLRNHVAANQREAEIDRDRRQSEDRAAIDAERERDAADAEQARDHGITEQTVKAAENGRVAAAQQANRLEREAAAAERRAENLDPKEANR